MTDPTTPMPTAGETPTGEMAEDQAASAVLGDLEALRNRVTTAEQQRDEYLALLQRTRADFENYQKRIQRDLAEEQRYGHASFARELLPVLDNLQRALDAAQQQAENSPMVQGVALVRSQLFEIFGRFGITSIEALGQPLDPHLHESVSQQTRADVALAWWSRYCNPVTACMSGSCGRPRWSWPRHPHMSRLSRDPGTLDGREFSLPPEGGRRPGVADSRAKHHRRTPIGILLAAGRQIVNPWSPPICVDPRKEEIRHVGKIEQTGL